MTEPLSMTDTPDPQDGWRCDTCGAPIRPPNVYVSQVYGRPYCNVTCYMESEECQDAIH